MAKGSGKKAGKRSGSAKAAEDRTIARIEKALEAALKREAKAASRLEAARAEAATLRALLAGALASPAEPPAVAAGPAAKAPVAKASRPASRPARARPAPSATPAKAAAAKAPRQEARRREGRTREGGCRQGARQEARRREGRTREGGCRQGARQEARRREGRTREAPHTGDSGRRDVLEARHHAGPCRVRHEGGTGQGPGEGARGQGVRETGPGSVPCPPGPSRRARRRELRPLSGPRAAPVYGAVDVGSNSVHLLVAAVRGRRVQPLADESVLLGLGDTVETYGAIPEPHRAELVSTLGRYAARARELGARDIAFVGTHPLRRAADARAVVQAVEHATGIPLHVLDHEEEGLLNLLGAMAGRSIAASVAVVDIGGGSSEVVVLDARAHARSGAIPIGCATLTRRLRGARPSNRRRDRSAPGPGTHRRSLRPRPAGRPR